jgi:hypothetical protein
MTDLRQAAQRHDEREAAGTAELRERITFSEQQLLEADVQRDMQKAVRLALRNDAYAAAFQLQESDVAELRRVGGL